MNNQSGMPSPSSPRSPSPSRVTCGNCGSQVDAGDVLCPSCGALIAAYQAPAESAVESPSAAEPASSVAEAPPTDAPRPGSFLDQRVPLAPEPEHVALALPEPASISPAAENVSEARDAPIPASPLHVSAPRIFFPPASPAPAARPGLFSSPQTPPGPGSRGFPSGADTPEAATAQFKPATATAPVSVTAPATIIHPVPRPKQDPPVSLPASVTPRPSLNERFDRPAKPEWTGNPQRPFAMPKFSGGQLGKIAPFAIIAFIILANVPGLMGLLGLLLVLGIAGAFLYAVLKAAHGTRRKTTDMPRGQRGHQRGRNRRRVWKDR